MGNNKSNCLRRRNLMKEFVIPKPQKLEKEKSEVDRLPSVTSPIFKDLMISYSHGNKDFMLKLKENLEKDNISVWVDTTNLGAGVDFLKKIGQAIIECQLFISIVSETSIKSKYCQDELALAYISEKSIFPINIASEDKLLPEMDHGMRLQLARFQWYPFLDQNKFEENMAALIKDLKTELNGIRSNTSHFASTKKHRSTKIYNRINTENPIDYWERNYSENQVDWNVFWYDLVNEFKTLFSIYNADDQGWLKSLLCWEMGITRSGILTKQKYIEFCTVDGILCPLWQKIEDQARESYAMKEVFNMDSHVRVEAIENLSKFKSSAVIDALIYLAVHDPEPNVRSVATISLAQTEITEKEKIEELTKVLKDDDRLVREAGCLTLGHLQVKDAIGQLLHLWRNDVIVDVRNAAEAALKQIGGDEIKRAMRITQVLAKEIRMLNNSN